MRTQNFISSTHYFPDFIHNKAVYVDKTFFVEKLLNKSLYKYVFLSRPRRFGKSLLVSTFEQVFLGKKDLFQGLYIYDKINWDEYNFLTIRISMDRIGFESENLSLALVNQAHRIAKNYDIKIDTTNAVIAFDDLIKQLFYKFKRQVVLLIDEYDKPIIYYIEKENVLQAETNKDILKSFYGVLKDNGEYLRFVFLTGVSKFSKVSIFSDLNNFDDLTLNDEFSTICGFTEREILTYCKPSVEAIAEKENIDFQEVMNKIKFYYDGFSWNARDFVYNPYSTALVLKTQAFKYYWFDSATPSFLVRLINKNFKYDFSNIIATLEDFSPYDFNNLGYVSMMLQTGYLTLKKNLGENYYQASFPNREVEKAFSKLLLEDYTHRHPQEISQTIYDIENLLLQGELNHIMTILQNMFKTLPYQFFQEEKTYLDKNGNLKTEQKAVGESFYHAIIYLIFNILGIRMNVEVSSAQGCIDAVVETNTDVYIFEFKKDKNPQFAIQQIKDKNYPNRFLLLNKKITLIGVTFTLRSRGISKYEIVPFTATPQ